MWRLAGVPFGNSRPAAETLTEVEGSAVRLYLGWRLAGGSPQPAATSALSRMVSPGPAGTRHANWRQTNFSNFSGAHSIGNAPLTNEIDWVQGLQESVCGLSIFASHLLKSETL
jgi:hypothetical protein